MAETFRLKDIRGTIHIRHYQGWKTFCGIEVMNFNGLQGPMRAQANCIHCLAVDAEPYYVPEGHLWLRSDD